MERNVRYITIGVMFLAVVVCMILFILWIGRIDLGEGKYKSYVVYSNTEISGISKNTPIKYKGIAVGHVSNIGFEDIKKGIIVVNLEIDSNLEIKEGTKVVVDSSGFVGSNFFNIMQGESTQALQGNILEYEESELSKLLAKAQGIGDNLESILSEQNSKNLAIIIDQLRLGTDNLSTLTTQTSVILEELNMKLKSGEYDIKTIVEPTLYGLEATLNKAEDFFSKANNFLDKMEKNPYDTIFGSPAQ